MNYMLLIYHDEQHANKASGCDGLAERLIESGQFVAGGILHPTPAATSLRMRGGKRLVTDGPFAETREQLAGYLLIEAADLDDALTVAEQHPVAAYGTVEIRPLLADAAETTGL
jgi:hypothetical protein